MLEHDLEAFLQVLVQHGYGSANDILDFQHCYRRIGANVLHRCLQIAGTCVGAETPAIVAQWVAQAGAGGHIDSFEYLLQSGELRTFHHLQQTLTLAPLGVPMLRYIREDRGVTNLPALRKWYYEEAPGINELRFWSVLDEIQRVLLDDAFERKNFTLLDGNRECVERLINQRIVTSIGAIPFPSDEATLGTYREAKRILLEQIVVELAPRLKNMLTETNGVLVKSLMEHIDEPLEQLRQRIADLAPLLGDLLSGRGPSGAALSDLEADLIPSDTSERFCRISSTIESGLKSCGRRTIPLGGMASPLGSTSTKQRHRLPFGSTLAIPRATPVLKTFRPPSSLPQRVAIKTTI